jgi:hypothetical protein
MPQVADFRGDRSQHEERVAARRQARAALLEWDARERELESRDRERLPSAVRALDDWSSSEHEAITWSSSEHEAITWSASEHEAIAWSASKDETIPWSADEAPPAHLAARPTEHDAAAPAPWSPSGGVPGRRTVTIRGQVADRYATPRPTSRRRPERRYERTGFRPDRAALWAVLLGVMLILAAVTSAHAATLHTLAHLH